MEREVLRLEVRGSRPMRLDQYLKEKLAWRSRTRIQQLIRTGRVRVEGREAKPSLEVRPGDRVEVRLSAGTGVPDYSEREIEVIYEDSWLLGINKPAGLLVHPVGRHVYDTLMNYLHYRYRESMTGDGGVHPRLCHRTDRDTTGVLLVGKDSFVHQNVIRQFEERRVSKRYLALVEGEVPPEIDPIDRPLAEGRSLEECLAGAARKPSRTRVQVLERLVSGGRRYSWVAASPLTGRQNQIRLHLAAVGHPLAGDERFGNGPAPEGFPARFILHAERLRFYHPRLKSEVELAAPLPRDVEDLLERLRKRHDSERC